MANLKDIKNRIGSVQKTRQITSAMKLVAAAKLRGATERAMAAQPYQAKLREVLGRVAAHAGDDVSHPLLERRESTHRLLLVLLTTDRGMCGGFNNILLRSAQKWIDAKKAEGVEVTIHVYGRKGRDFCRNRDITVEQSTVEYARTERMELVQPLADTIVSGYADGTFDEVWFGYNTFVNAATQTPGIHRVVPMQVEGDDAGGSNVDYLYEPSPQLILGALLPLYLKTLILQAFLETEAGEQGAKMLAMDNATRNATELIDQLSLAYNRARQAAITTEITEIVSGAEAL